MTLKDEGYSNRKIGQVLNVNRETVTKYLKNPEVAVYRKINKQSKLEHYYEDIAQYLKEDKIMLVVRLSFRNLK